MKTIPDATAETNECFNVTIYVPEMPCASNVIVGKKNMATVCLCDSSSEYAVIKHSCYVVLICAVLDNYRCLVFCAVLHFSCTEVHGSAAMCDCVYKCMWLMYLL